MLPVSSPLLSSPNTPTRVAKGASPSAHQQRDGALFKVLVNNTHPHQRQIIPSITRLIGRLSPEIIPANDQTGFFSNVKASPGGTSFDFESVYSCEIENTAQQGLLIAVGEHLPTFRAIHDISGIKGIVSDPELKETLDSLKTKVLTDLLAKQVPNFTIRSKEDVLTLIQAVVLSLKEPWSPENIAKVKTKIDEYLPFLND
jgi:hypothetical protein